MLVGYSDLIVTSINQPRSDIKYKRRIWAGIRKDSPTLLQYPYVGSTTTFSEDIISVGLLPCLIVWESESGEQKYTEVTTNKRSKRSYR